MPIMVPPPYLTVDIINILLFMSRVYCTVYVFLHLICLHVQYSRELHVPAIMKRPVHQYIV